MPIARVRGATAEVVTADLAWRAGDELIVLSRFPQDVTFGVLDHSGGTRRAAASRDGARRDGDA